MEDPTPQPWKDQPTKGPHIGIVDRHCRMLGFRPYKSEVERAVLVNAPQFLEMQSGEFKKDGPQIPNPQPWKELEKWTGWG